MIIIHLHLYVIIVYILTGLPLLTIILNLCEIICQIMHEIDILYFVIGLVMGFPTESNWILIASETVEFDIIELFIREKINLDPNLIRLHKCFSLKDINILEDYIDIIISTAAEHRYNSSEFSYQISLNDYIYIFIIKIGYKLWVYIFCQFYNIFYYEIFFIYKESFLIQKLFVLWIKTITCAILTIWARGVGPRFRVDQMSDLTWKDLLVILIGFLFVILYYMLFT